jgi:hypothetical protein
VSDDEVALDSSSEELSWEVDAHLAGSASEGGRNLPNAAAAPGRPLCRGKASEGPGRRGSDWLIRKSARTAIH